MTRNRISVDLSDEESKKLMELAIFFKEQGIISNVKPRLIIKEFLLVSQYEKMLVFKKGK